jgi:alpha-1,6-mannosyltransferase
MLREAFARLGRGYHLLLIGGGGHQRPAGNVTVIPYHRDSRELARVLASVDALVHAGSSETFGLVVLEAMACGRPVVGVNAAAVAELIDENVGVKAERASAKLLAQAVRDLYDRNLETLGSAARARVLTRYGWDSALQHQLAVYASLTEKKRIAPDGWATASRRASGDQQIMPAGPSSN